MSTTTKKPKKDPTKKPTQRVTDDETGNASDALRNLPRINRKEGAKGETKGVLNE